MQIDSSIYLTQREMYSPFSVTTYWNGGLTFNSKSSFQKYKNQTFNNFIWNWMLDIKQRQMPYFKTFTTKYKSGNKHVRKLLQKSREEVTRKSLEGLIMKAT